MYVRPFTIAIQCAAWSLLLVQRRGRGRRRRSKTKAARRAHRAHARAAEAAPFPLRWAVPRGTWVEWARERRRRENLTKEGKRKSESGAVRVRDARACDEEDFQDRVTGEGMGCGREDNLFPGSPGRGGFGKWGRLFGDVSVRRQMVSVWVNKDVLCVPSGAALSTGGGRRALHRKERTERPRAARSTPAPNLSPRRPRDTQGGRGKRRREAERGSLGVSMGILPGRSR